MSVAHSWAGSGQSAESPRFWSPQQPLSLPEPGSAFGSFLGYCQGLCVCLWCCTKMPLLSLEEGMTTFLSLPFSFPVRRPW